MQQAIVLGHIRLSDGQDGADSPKRQESSIRAWCRREGYDQARIELYADVIGRHSGRKEKGRPEWSRLKARLGDEQVAVVIVESISRLFRNLELAIVFAKRCAKQGIRFVSIAENIDFDPADFDVPLECERNVELEVAMKMQTFQQHAAMAQAWSDITSANMKAKVRRARAKGKHWGTCPFGSMRDEEQKLARDNRGVWYRPPQGENGPLWAKEPQDPTGWEWRGYWDALHRLYELYRSQQHGWASLTEQLNLEGWRYADRWGEPRAFTRDDVRRCIAMHQTYAGNLIKGRSQSAKGPAILKEGAWEPLLPLDLINDVAEILESRRHVQRTPARRNVYPLTPLLHCAACDRPLVGQTEIVAKGGTRFYRHSHKGKCRADVGQVHADEVEARAADLMADLALPPESWPLLEAVLLALADDDEEDREARAKLEVVKRRRERLRELYVEQFVQEMAVLSPEGFRAKLDRYDAEIGDLEKQIRARSDLGVIQEAMQQIGQLAALIKNAGLHLQKEIFASIFVKVAVDLNTGEVVRYQPAPWVRYYVYSVIECARRDSNPHDFAVTSPSS